MFVLYETPAGYAIFKVIIMDFVEILETCGIDAKFNLKCFQIY